MCIEQFHECKYCTLRYPCNLKDIACPTINEDQDRNLCNSCREELEEELSNLDPDAKLPRIHEILDEDD